MVSSGAKRQREDCDTSQTPPKYRRISQQSAHEALTRLDRLHDSAHNLPPDQLLSSTFMKSGQEFFSLATGKRKAHSLDCLSSMKRTRLLSEPLREQPSIAGWLQQLPLDNKFETVPEKQHSMSQPPAKRSRCTDSLGQTSQSGDSTETAVSRDKKRSQYKDVNYPVVLETKGSFMRPSEQGMADEDKQLCEKLFTTSQSIPQDILFDDEHFPAFCLNLQSRFELSTTFDEISVQSSQDNASAIESQDELNTPLRNVIQGLQRQLEQQRQDAEQQWREMKERETMLLNQLEQQRKDFEQQRKDFEQQRKDFKQQRKDSEQQSKDFEQQLIEMLRRQSDQITLLLDRQ